MAVRRLVAALQRVAAADTDTQLDAAIAAADLDELSSALQQGATQQVGAALAAALARCLRVVSGKATAASKVRLQRLGFAEEAMFWMQNLGKCADTTAGKGLKLWQDVCSTELLAVMPAACASLAAQLKAQAQQRTQSMDDAVLTVQLHSGARRMLALYRDLAQLRCGVQQDAPATASSAAAKMPMAEAVAAAASLTTVLLLQFESGAAAGAEARVASAGLLPHNITPAWKTAALLGSVAKLLQCAADSGQAALAEAVAAAPELPWLAALGLAGVAASAYAATGGLPADKFAAGVSSSQGAPTPAHHSALLSAVGMTSLETAFETAARDDEWCGEIVEGSFLVFQGLAKVLASSRSNRRRGGSSGSITAGQMLLLLRPVVAELMVLDSRPGLVWLGSRLFDSITTAAHAMHSAMPGRDFEGPADEEALSLLLLQMLPAVLHAAAAVPAADASGARVAQEALDHTCRLITCYLRRGEMSTYSIFEGDLFQEQPAALMSSFEAVVRRQVCSSSQEAEQSFVAMTVMAQALRSGLQGQLHTWLMDQATTVVAARAGSSKARQAGANCTRLLCLLVACTKSTVAYIPRAQPSTTMQLAAGYNLLMLAGLLSRLQIYASGALQAFAGALQAFAGALQAAAQQQAQKQQLLLDGYTHLLGRTLIGAGSILTGALEEPAARNLALGGTGPAAQLELLPALKQTLHLLSGLLQHNVPGSDLPLLSTPAWAQQELTQQRGQLAAAVAAFEGLWNSPAARRAAAQAAAGTPAGEEDDVRVTAQLCLLRLNPAVAQQLSGSLVAMGGVLCAALPTKHACNDPACTSCDKASEQQLVSGKGSVCSACRVARYCCVEHQRRHWRAHRPACKALVAAAAAAGGGCGQASSGNPQE